MSICLLYTVYNRAELLAHSLARLRELTLPDEIVVVDDGGTDNCGEVCAKFAAFNLPYPIKYIYTHNPGPALCSHARNVGIRNTDCDEILTCEPECLFVTDAVAQFREARKSNPLDVISAGVVDADKPDGSTEERIGWVAPFAALYRREWLLEVGGWDEQMPGNYAFDDTDLLTRLRISGYGQYIDLSIRLRHRAHEPNMTSQQINADYFFSKGFNEGNREFVVANQGIEWGVAKSR